MKTQLVLISLFNLLVVSPVNAEVVTGESEAEFNITGDIKDWNYNETRYLSEISMLAPMRLFGVATRNWQYVYNWAQKNLTPRERIIMDKAEEVAFGKAYMYCLGKRQKFLANDSAVQTAVADFTESLNPANGEVIRRFKGIVKITFSCGSRLKSFSPFSLGGSVIFGIGTGNNTGNGTATQILTSAIKEARTAEVLSEKENRLRFERGCQNEAYLLFGQWSAERAQVHFVPVKKSLARTKLNGKKIDAFTYQTSAFVEVAQEVRAVCSFPEAISVETGGGTQGL